MTTYGFLTFDREEIFSALFALVTPCYEWNQEPSRRLKLWADVPVENRPALYQFEGGDEDWDWSNPANPKVALYAKLFVYTASKEPSVVGATQINDVLDAVMNALLPKAGDPTGRQTLGGLVRGVQISGKVFRDPGDLDGDGMVIVPVKLIVS